MDSLAVTLAVTALLLGAVADLLYRVAQQRGIDAPNFIFWQSTIFTAIIWGVAASSWVLLGDDGPVDFIHRSTWLYGVPAGVFGYLGLTLFVASLRTGGRERQRTHIQAQFRRHGVGSNHHPRRVRRPD